MKQRTCKEDITITDQLIISIALEEYKNKLSDNESVNTSEMVEDTQRKVSRVFDDQHYKDRGKITLSVVESNNNQ